MTETKDRDLVERACGEIDRSASEKGPISPAAPPVQHPAGPKGEELLEAHAENQTPAAHRIFGFRGPDKQEILFLAIESPP